MSKREVMVVLLAVIVLGLVVSYRRDIFDIGIAIITVLFIVCANIFTKKVVANILEADIVIKPWSIYQYGLRKGAHFKEPLPMIWLPVVLAMISKGVFWWLAVLTFQVKPKKGRVSKKHGLYRFTEMTEKDIGIIALTGVITNILLAIIMYILGFEFFTQVSTLYALWSLIPFSNLDGAKIFFSNPTVWAITSIITGILSVIALSL